MARNSDNADQKVTEQAVKTVQDSDVSGGDVLGATQDPSPTLQADAVNNAQASVDGDATVDKDAGTITSENGTVTDVPSARLSKDQLKGMNGSR